MEKVFTGTESMTVDSKGRVGIPARFMAVLRALAPDDADAVGVTITPDYSLKIMPIPVFDEEIARLSQLNDQVEEERVILNLMASFAERVPLDKQNRLKLNPLIMDFCSIGREVVITGSIKYLQIWDEAAWRSSSKERLARLGAASALVARKGEAKTPVQYVINADGAEHPPVGPAPAVR